MAKYKCVRLDGTTKKYRNKIDSYEEAAQVAAELGLSLTPTGYYDIYKPVTAFEHLCSWISGKDKHPDLNSGDGIIYVVAYDQAQRRYAYEENTERCLTYTIDVNSVLCN